MRVSEKGLRRQNLTLSTQIVDLRQKWSQFPGSFALSPRSYSGACVPSSLKMKLVKSLAFMSRYRWVFLIVIIGIYLMNYGRGIQFNFVWDDHFNVQRSESPLEGGLSQAFSISQSDLMFKKNGGRELASYSNSSYRPLQFVSYWLDFHIFSRSAAAMHLHSIILGLFFLILFYFLSARVLESSDLAICALALLSFHPLLVENIAYVSARSDLMMSFFCLASIYVGFGGSSNGTMKGWQCYFLIFVSSLLFFLALLSKEPAVALPFVALAIWRVAGAKKPFAFFSGLVMTLLIYLGIRRYFFSLKADQYQFSSFLHLPQILFEYFRVLILPFDLSITRQPKTPLWLGWTFTGLVFAGCASATAVRSSLRKPLLLLGFVVLSILLFVAPGVERIDEFGMPDRYILIPLCIFIWALLLTLKSFWTRVSVSAEKILGFVFILWLGLLGLLSFSLAPVWKNDKTLVVRNLMMNPTSSLANVYAAILYMNVGDCRDAYPLLNRAIELDPDSTRALINLGQCSLTDGNPTQAVTYFSRVEQMENSPPADFYVQFAEARFALHQFKEGCDLLTKAYVGEPDHPRIAPLRKKFCQEMSTK